jgi:hypothetical protein
MTNNPIFISYSSIDKPFVDRLVKDITSIGARTSYLPQLKQNKNFW